MKKESGPAIRFQWKPVEETVRLCVVIFIFCDVPILIAIQRVQVTDESLAVILSYCLVSTILFLGYNYCSLKNRCPRESKQT